MLLCNLTVILGDIIYTYITAGDSQTKERRRTVAHHVLERGHIKTKVLNTEILDYYLCVTGKLFDLLIKGPSKPILCKAF